jgi:hypothetical protein
MLCRPTCYAGPHPRKAVHSRKLPQTAVAHIEMFNFFREDLLAWPPYDADVQHEIARNIKSLEAGEVLPLEGRIEVTLTDGTGDWQAQGAAQTLAEKTIFVVLHAKSWDLQTYDRCPANFGARFTPAIIQMLPSFGAPGPCLPYTSTTMRMVRELESRE